MLVSCSTFKKPLAISVCLWSYKDGSLPAPNILKCLIYNNKTDNLTNKIHTFLVLSITEVSILFKKILHHERFRTIEKLSQEKNEIK
jgi:hypothetical protein